MENLVSGGNGNGNGKQQSQKNFALQVGLGAGLREQERVMDELKKENFDLKLRCYHLEDQLRKQTPANTSELLSENDSLRTSQEALNIECRTLRDCLSECQVSLEKAKLQNSNTSTLTEEIVSLKEDLSLTQNQLSKSASQIKNYEQQLEVFDEESRESVKKIRRLEMLLKEKEEKEDLFASANATANANDSAELEELREELSLKVGFLEQIRLECRQLHADLELSHRQRQELEKRCADLQEELSNSSNDNRNNSQNSNAMDIILDQTPGTPNSSGIDMMETRMVNQIGRTSAQLSQLSRSNELSITEREALQNRLATLDISTAATIKGLHRLCERLNQGGFGHLSSDNNDENDENENNENKTADHLIKQLNDSTLKMMLELSSVKERADFLEKEYAAQKDINVMSQRDNKERLAAIEKKLSKERESKEEIELQLREAKEALLKSEHQLRVLKENELPRYKEQVVQQQHSLRTMEEELQERQNVLQSVRQKEQQRLETISALEAEKLTLSNDLQSLEREIIVLKERNSSFKSKLTKQEQDLKEMNSVLEEEKEKLSSAEKVKEKVEQRWKGEMMALHQANSDLRSQLGNLSSGKIGNEERLQRLQGHLRYLEGVNDEMIAKATQKSKELALLEKEHNSLLDERHSLAQRIKQREHELSSAQEEVVRLRKSDSVARRGAEGLSHLEERIQSLQSTNQLLRQQLEERDAKCKEGEERLRRQDNAIRKAYSDCEQQSARIKKREMVISRVLKRLENINGGGNGGGGHLQQQQQQQQHVADLASLQNNEDYIGNAGGKKSYESNLRF